MTGNGRTIGEGHDVVVKGFVEADSSHVRISEGGEKKREPFSLHVYNVSRYEDMSRT